MRVGGIFKDIAAVRQVIGQAVAVPSDQASELSTEQLEEMPTAYLKRIFQQLAIKDERLGIARFRRPQGRTMGEMDVIIQEHKSNRKLITMLITVIGDREGFVLRPTSKAEKKLLLRQQAPQIQETCSIQ